MLFTLRFGTFLVPINDSLVRNTILVVQNLRSVNSSQMGIKGNTFKMGVKVFMIRVSS